MNGDIIELVDAFDELNIGPPLNEADPYSILSFDVWHCIVNSPHAKNHPFFLYKMQRQSNLRNNVSCPKPIPFVERCKEPLLLWSSEFTDAHLRLYPSKRKSRKLCQQWRINSILQRSFFGERPDMLSVAIVHMSSSMISCWQFQDCFVLFSESHTTFECMDILLRYIEPSKSQLMMLIRAGYPWADFANISEENYYVGLCLFSSKIEKEWMQKVTSFAGIENLDQLHERLKQPIDRELLRWTWDTFDSVPPHFDHVKCFEVALQEEDLALLDFLFNTVKWEWTEWVMWRYALEIFQSEEVALFVYNASCMSDALFRKLKDTYNRSKKHFNYYPNYYY